MNSKFSIFKKKHSAVIKQLLTFLDRFKIWTQNGGLPVP